MRSQIRASVQGFHSSHDASSPSAARQPQPIPHRMKTSKTLAVAKHAIPLCPFANKTKCQEHAIFPLSPAFLPDAHLISLLRLYRYSCYIFPGARVPPAANRRGTRPDRNRDRLVRYESQALADEFRPRLARSCLFLPKRPTESGLAACSDHSWPHLVIS